jgi:OOP family OmpA-OmpF porin
MNQRLLTQPLPLAAVLLAAALALPALAQAPAAKPATPQAAKADNAPKTRTASLPAKGLFVGDQLSDGAKKQLTDLVIDALGLDVEVALMVPTGPWVIDGAGHTERDLTDKRLAALRKFLTDRGIESKRIFVESRVDAKIKEPRLDVQLIGRPATN